LDELYREVSDEVHAMHNLLLIRRSQLEEAATRRLERLVGFLGLSSAFPIWFSPSWISTCGASQPPRKAYRSHRQRGPGVGHPDGLWTPPPGPALGAEERSVTGSQVPGVRYCTRCWIPGIRYPVPGTGYLDY
jgi:hypothetical protein